MGEIDGGPAGGTRKRTKKPRRILVYPIAVPVTHQKKLHKDDILVVLRLKPRNDARYKDAEYAYASSDVPFRDAEGKRVKRDGERYYATNEYSIGGAFVYPNPGYAGFLSALAKFNKAKVIYDGLVRRCLELETGCDSARASLDATKIGDVLYLDKP